MKIQLRLCFIMNLSFFKKTTKSYLGIDIGTSAIKIVELSRQGERVKLENFGELKSQALYQKPFRTFEKNTLFLLTDEIALAVKGILKEANIQSKSASFSIPDFSTFFTNFELPSMTAEELPEAVEFEARRQIPLPVSEMVLDWQIIAGKPSLDKKSREKIKILLVAVPLEIINQYQEIAKKAGLELLALEAEVFGLIRSLTDKEMGTVAIIDIGAQSTTVNIVEKSILKTSNSFDTGGNELTRVIAQSRGIDFWKAETLKGKYGLLQGKDEEVSNVLFPLIDSIIQETENAVKNSSLLDGKEISKFILAGGAAYLPGFMEYFSQKMGKEVIIGDPFSKIFTPPILNETLKTMGPSFAIAVGTALREVL